MMQIWNDVDMKWCRYIMMYIWNDADMKWCRYEMMSIWNDVHMKWCRYVMMQIWYNADMKWCRYETMQIWNDQARNDQICVCIPNIHGGFWYMTWCICLTCMIYMMCARIRTTFRECFPPQNIQRLLPAAKCAYIHTMGWLRVVGSLKL